MSKALTEQGRQENCLVHHLFISNEWERKNEARQSRWSQREEFLMRGVRKELSRRVVESPCRRCWISVILLQWKAERCNCTGLRQKGRKLNYRSAETVVMKTFQKHRWAWEPSALAMCRFPSMDKTCFNSSHRHLVLPQPSVLKVTFCRKAAGREEEGVQQILGGFPLSPVLGVQVAGPAIASGAASPLSQIKSAPSLPQSFQESQ